MKVILAAALAAGWTIATPVSAQGVDGEAMYSHVENYWLQHRDARLAEERDMSDPVWVGDIGPDANLIIVEGDEARRVLFLLRTWANSDEADFGDIDLLPDLDRGLIDRFGIDEIAAMSNHDIGTAVAMLRANRDRVLERYAGVVAVARDRFQQARDTRISAEQPNLSPVYDSTYGEIHWQDGWYGDETKTIAVQDVYEDADRGGWVVEGRWGRTNSDRDGGFAFLFGSSCQFAGSWWYGEKSEDTVGTAWSGECQ